MNDIIYHQLLPLGLMAVLAVKHNLLDFRFQPPYMWMNKGTFGHPGGLLHSGLHAAATWLILPWFVMHHYSSGTQANNLQEVLIMMIGVTEFVIHYLTDWAKMNINRIKGWKCNEHPQFWALTGDDQMIHCLTYVGIAVIMVIMS